MGCFNFIPEGWNDKREIYELGTIKEAYETGKTIQGYVDECDSDCNLYITYKILHMFSGIFALFYNFLNFP